MIGGYMNGWGDWKRDIGVEEERGGLKDYTILLGKGLLSQILPAILEHLRQGLDQR